MTDTQWKKLVTNFMVQVAVKLDINDESFAEGLTVACEETGLVEAAKIVTPPSDPLPSEAFPDEATTPSALPC